MRRDERGGRAEQVIVETVVALAMLAAAITGLGYLLGPHGLDLISGKPDWPLLGSGQSRLALETEITAPVTIDGVPGTGAGDPATGGRPVEVGGPYTAQVTLLAPTTGERWSWTIWQAAGPLLAATGLGVVLLMLRSARLGDPFTRANLRRLQVLTALVLVGGTLVSWGGAFVRRMLLDSSAAAEVVPIDFYFGFLPIVGGLLIAVLTEVWRRGVRMREDLEGLV